MRAGESNTKSETEPRIASALMLGSRLDKDLTGKTVD